MSAECRDVLLSLSFEGKIICEDKEDAYDILEYAESEGCEVEPSELGWKIFWRGTPLVEVIVEDDEDY